jgi:hypothetical protein
MKGAKNTFFLKSQDGSRCAKTTKIAFLINGIYCCKLYSG